MIRLYSTFVLGTALLSRVVKSRFPTTLLIAVAATLAGAAEPAHAADGAFRAFLDATWPEARQLGVSRQTFERATRDLEPDLSLPDLVSAGREPKAEPGQPEFVRAPAEYVSEKTIATLAGQARRLWDQHRATLDSIERRFGVPPTVLLAIWGRETAFGAQRDGKNAFRVLATQAYLGRRKEQFRVEFVTAMKMIEDGHATFSDMHSSWAGAMGLTQFLPTEFYRHGVDFDGDGRIDIFHSVPDALASAAKQLVDKGWHRGTRWAYEVRAPANLDCTMADPDRKAPIGEWVKRGFAPAYGRGLKPEELNEPASLLLPAGIYGPAFLTTKNYFVIKEYNFSDLYVLFVGHLSDRIADPRPFETPWGKVKQLQTRQVEQMQQHMTAQGYYADKLDGKAGMKTRLALGAYQKANGMRLDCWPTGEALAHMQRRAGAR